MKGSLWAHQIAREKENVAHVHRKVTISEADTKEYLERAKQNGWVVGVGPGRWRNCS